MLSIAKTNKHTSLTKPTIHAIDSENSITNSIYIWEKYAENHNTNKRQNKQCSKYNGNTQKSVDAGNILVTISP